ncbi:MAG TPA: hypothetical protein VF681_00685 [Abditibacteriaceae bacterium]|jgi:hypothetical protein
MSAANYNLDSDTQIAEPVSTPSRQILVQPMPAGRKIGEAQRKAVTVDRLKDWQYLERSLHRMIAGWGRYLTEWDDIVVCHRHVWEQSECVRRLRDRLGQFPGAAQHLDAPVSVRLEKLVNTVLLAPSFEDALSGMYQVLMGALCRSYQLYAASAHQVHDAPTIATLHEVIGFHEQMRLWLRDYRRRNPHTINEAYKNAIDAELANCGGLLEALPVEGDGAAPVGVNTDFRLPAKPGRPPGSLPGYAIKPYLSVDFQTSLEARRLFWAYAYMLEMNLAMDQLRWIYDGHFMPWDFLQDISRHLWDESRHGDSGHSRLLDFGITIPDIGFPPYVDADTEDQVAPLSPEELYETVFSIGLIAETGHFTVKRQAYDDFLEGGDLESAEMMLFDIIDETTHVQYAHKWLPLLAEKAGVDNTDYKERAARMRRETQQKHHENLHEWANLPRDLGHPTYAKYQELLEIMRERQPLLNAQTCAPRDPLPM